MKKPPETPGKRQELEENLARAKQLNSAQQARIVQLEQENKNLVVSAKSGQILGRRVINQREA